MMGFPTRRDGDGPDFLLLGLTQSPGPVGAFSRQHTLRKMERPRPSSVRLICHHGRTCADRERTTPKIARRKQRTRP